MGVPLPAGRVVCVAITRGPSCGELLAPTSFLPPPLLWLSLNLAGEECPAVGDAGDPGVLFLSLQGEDPLVLSPDLLREFCLDSPVPIWLDWGKGAGVGRLGSPPTSSSLWAAKARVRSR